MFVRAVEEMHFTLCMLQCISIDLKNGCYQTNNRKCIMWTGPYIKKVTNKEFLGEMPLGVNIAFKCFTWYWALILSASVTIEYFYISTKRNVWSMAIHNRFMNIGAIDLITVTVFSCIKLYIKMKKTESTTNVYQFMKHVYCVIIHI